MFNNKMTPTKCEICGRDDRPLAFRGEIGKYICSGSCYIAFTWGYREGQKAEKEYLKLRFMQIVEKWMGKIIGEDEEEE